MKIINNKKSNSKSFNVSWIQSNKTQKWVRIFIEFLLMANMLGIFFIYTPTLETPTYENSQGDIVSYPIFNTPVVMQFLFGTQDWEPKGADFALLTAIGWTSISIMGVSWIIWEFAQAKSGNLYLLMFSVIGFLIQMFVSINLLSILSLVIALCLILFYAYSSKMKWESSKKVSDVIIESKNKDKSSTNSLLSKLSFKKKRT